MIVKMDKLLSKAAYELAMLALQSERYQIDDEYREVTNRVLTLTKFELSERLKGK